jgi:hypothetical protein
MELLFPNFSRKDVEKAARENLHAKAKTTNSKSLLLNLHKIANPLLAN